jgi:ferredoxin
MKVTVIDIGQFEWPSGAPNLLHALEDAGLDISYSCRSGACGACQLRLVEGSVHWVQQPSVSLPSGEMLACCVIPKGDISIQLPD